MHKRAATRTSWSFTIPAGNRNGSTMWQTGTEDKKKLNFLIFSCTLSPILFQGEAELREFSKKSHFHSCPRILGSWSGQSGECSKSQNE